jgi:tRNA U34 5-methylaminomethyl-2-thiouridine-forming methyltransferase MnmC
LHSFDSTAEPLEFAVRHAEELGYLAGWLTPVKALLAKGVAQTGRVTWQFHRADFRDFIRARAGAAPDAILYDPYSPAANPEMWSVEHFTRLRECLGPDARCTLTSYSRSTAVRVSLTLAGFCVGPGGATGEKDETTLAATHRDMLAERFGAAWLGRVGRSTRGGALREGMPPGPISPEEFVALAAAVAGGGQNGMSSG